MAPAKKCNLRHPRKEPLPSAFQQLTGLQVPRAPVERQDVRRFSARPPKVVENVCGASQPAPHGVRVEPMDITFFGCAVLLGLVV